jgi:serine/threonine-protein kinase
MGEVYLAHDSQLRRSVALKLLPSEFTQNKERLQRFEHEAYAASALNNPNILTIYEVGTQQDLHYIATEYIEGESLRERLHRRPMELREVLDVCLANSDFGRHFHPRDQDELSQSFDFPIFKRCNQIETGLFKRERV